MVCFEDSIFFKGAISGTLLHDGVVSELSSSGLLLSSVSFPLLPKLHPPLSLSGEADEFFAVRRERDEVVDAVAFLMFMLFFSVNSCSSNCFEDGILEGFTDALLSLFVLLAFSPPFLDNDELDDDDNEDEVDDGPILEVINVGVDKTLTDDAATTVLLVVPGVAVFFVLVVVTAVDDATKDDDKGVLTLSPFFCCAMC